VCFWLIAVAEVRLYGLLGELRIEDFSYCDEVDGLQPGILS
jgi:hypothetical protein